MSVKTRCFISLDLPDVMISELQKVQSELEKQKLFDGKFTEKENLHLTLKFLGSLSNTTVKKIESALSTIKMKSFEVSLGETGVFSEEFVRIIWVTLNNAYELQKKVDEVVIDDFPHEERFMSHITLARVKNLKDKEAVISAVKELKCNECISQVKSFSLMKSTLTPEGSIHEVIRKYKLE